MNDAVESRIAGFNDAWYAEIIERFDSGNGEPTSRAMLAGFCILAQAVDGLAEAVRNKR